MSKHAFTAFDRSDFGHAARIFWEHGYKSVDGIKDMDARERELFLSTAKSAHRDGNRNRSCLADLRLILRIFAWFEPHGRLRGGAQVADEIAIDRRMRDWSVSLTGIAGSLQPEQDMTNYFSSELEKGRISRPPYVPYVTVDSLASYPWMPPDEPHNKALERWKTNQSTFHRMTGDQDLSLGQYVLYRMRFVLSGDLAGDWSDFGGLTAQINNIAYRIRRGRS